MANYLGSAFGRAVRYKPPKLGLSPGQAQGQPTAPAQRPVDPIYDQTIGGLQKRRDDTLAGLTQQKVGTLADYGYGATFDPTSGDVTGLSFDPANPFSRAALLRRNYQQAKTGTANSLASRGQLYSGAMANAQNANDFGYLQGENSLQGALTQTLIGIAQRGRGAGTDYELGGAQAGAESVNRAIAQDTGVQAFAGQATPPAPPAPSASAATTPPRSPAKNRRRPAGRLGGMHFDSGGK